MANPAKKRVYPPKNRPRVDAETLRLRALRGNDPPAVEAPAADSSHLPAARGRVIGRPVRAPAQDAPRDPREDRIALYAPYEKQRAFHDAGARHRERLFMAGNQLGKTTAGAMEAALHATGLYPDWWQGRRFDKPTTGWVAGITAETTRDTVQRLLLGRPRGENKGVIPDRLIEKVSNSYTIAGVTDTIMIRHASGGLSVLAFKSYEKGRAKWQGESLDFGWDHPTAAVRMAIDPEADCLYVTHTYRQAEATPIIHAAVLKDWGPGLDWAWPADGLAHDKGSGVRLAELYRKQGLALLRAHATFEDGSMGVEAGLLEMLERMQSGRWKVFRHLADWFEEFRLYHRREGRVVKREDDLLAASRYAMMMRRFATCPARSSWDTPIKYDSRWVV